MIEDRQILRAISRIKIRSDTFEENALFGRTFVDIGVLDELDNDNHQILYGRRGTGKTHVFKVLEGRLENEKGVVVAYLDSRTLGSTGQLSQSSPDASVVCLDIFRDILTRLHWLLLDYIIEHPNAQADKSLQVADEFLSAISDPTDRMRPSQVAEEMQYDKRRESGRGAEISASSGLKLSLDAKTTTAKTSSVTTQYNVTTTDDISYITVIRNLEKLLTLNKIRLVILIDEWSSINAGYQPVLADFIKRTLLVCNNVTVKIAAMEARATFNSWSHNNRIGFEVGSDIFSAPHLDDYFINEQEEEYLAQLYMAIMYNHLNSNLPFDYLRKRHHVTDGHTLADRMISPKALTELVRAAEGVIRDLINIVILALSRASKGRDEEYTGKIEAIHVVEAATQWFERDKLQSVPAETIDALTILEKTLIGEKRTRFFAVPSIRQKSPLLLGLLDARLVHAVWKNMSHPTRPGIRCSVYCLDYGSCLSVLRTTDKYRRNVKYQDVMQNISIKLNQVREFDDIMTENVFGAERVE